MKMFLLWFAGVVLAISAYLAYLWWHPRKRLHFQVRLTAIFLLFAFVPVVPLVLVASSLATGTADMLLVPEIQASMLHAIEAIKMQFEERARNFVQATQSGNVDPELLQRWQFDYYLVWRQNGEAVQLITAVGKDMPSRQIGLAFGMDRVGEIWGQTGSQIHVQEDHDLGVVERRCEVWLPRTESEMALLGFGVPAEVAAVKDEISAALRVYNSLSLIKERALQDQVVWGAAVAVVFVLALSSIIIARAISRKISGPIEDLTVATARVAEGDLTVQAETAAKDEIGVLVDSFNRMILDLKSSREKLIAAERVAAWREVARQVSHEIKNPLTPINLALYRIRQRLGEWVESQPAVRESFQSIEEELSALAHLADEFSSFARLPSAKLIPDDINEIVRLTGRLHQGTEANCNLKLDLATDLPLRPLDREQIKRLLHNLIKNSLEAMTGRRCNILIITRKEGERVSLMVADNGPGVSPEFRQRIFEPHSSTKRGGSGLGLVMVKRIVEEHGGTIEVESELGKGTAFKILI